MRIEDKRLIVKIKDSALDDYSNAGFEETLNKSKHIFYAAEAKMKISFFEFIWQQSKYINKKWWVLQLCILVALWTLINVSGQDMHVNRIFGISASLFAMLIIPEIWKNRETNSTEIECTSMYTLRQINAARMLIFSFIDLLLLSLFAITCITTGKFLIQNMLIHFLLPFVVTCCICFTCFYGKIQSMGLTIICCVFWCGLWTWMVQNERVYNMISLPVWLILLAISFVYLFFCISKGQRRANDLWEAKIEWN